MQIITNREYIQFDIEKLHSSGKCHLLSHTLIFLQVELK